MPSHFRGPLLGARDSENGLFADLPIEAVGKQTASLFHQDFHNSFDEDDWVVTDITSGTADIIQDVANGIYRLTATTANQGLGSVQWTNADAASEGIATPLADRVIAMEARVACNDWSDCDWYVGLGETDTTFLSNAGAILANGGDNHIGFTHRATGDGTPIATFAGTAVANVENPTVSAGTTALTDDAYYRFGVRIVNTDEVRFYINGAPITAWTTMGTAFDGGMTLTFGMIANGSAITLDVDYVTVAATR